MVFGEPPRSQGDLSFVVFGFPVRVHPWFWLVAAMLGITGRRDSDMRTALLDLAVWVCALFFAILVHELGHAFAARAYGMAPSIALHGMGGLTSYQPLRRLGTLGEIIIAASGPAAGFLLAAAIVLLAALVGRQAVLLWLGPLPAVLLVDTIGSEALTDLLNGILQISVLWGVVNLLPVYPLDGGQIMRELLLRVSPREGIRYSLTISFLAAAAIALYALVRLNAVFMAFLFGYLAYISYATLSAYRQRRQ